MPSPMAKSTLRRPKVSKKQLITYLLQHAVDLTFTAEELARLPINILLNEKVHILTDEDASHFHSTQEMTAIEFILAQPDNFLSRADLEVMCADDLIDEEGRMRNKMRNCIAKQHLSNYSQ